MKLAIVKGLLFLLLLVVVCSFSLRAPAAASTASPRASLVVCIFSIEPQAQAAKVSFNLTMTSQDGLGQVIVGQVISPTEVATLHLKGTGSQYENVSSILGWALQGRTQDYPFDSYSMGLSVHTAIMFPNGTVGVYAELSNVTPRFCGDNAQTLGTTWYFQSPTGQVTQSTFPMPTHDQATIVIVKNEQWGWLVMLPIWIALIFVGAMFILESDKPTDRLTMLMALFVFAPVYLFTIIGQSPPSPIYNLSETQLIFLIITILVGGLSTLANTRTSSPVSRVRSDSVAVIFSEVAYFALTFRLFLLAPAPSWVIYSYLIALSSYAATGIIALVWRFHAFSQESWRKFFLRMLLNSVGRPLGLMAFCSGVLIMLFSPITGFPWVAAGLLILTLVHLVKSIKRVKRALA